MRLLSDEVIGGLVADVMNVYLADGRANLEDARAFADRWNKTKVSTTALVFMVGDRGFRHPMIVIGGEVITEVRHLLEA